MLHLTRRWLAAYAVLAVVVVALAYWFLLPQVAPCFAPVGGDGTMICDEAR